MKRTVFVCAMILLLALVVVGGMAQGRCGGKGPGMAAGNPGMTCQSILGLTQAQLDEIAKLKTAFWNDTTNLQTELQKRQQEIANLWTAQDPNLDLIKEKAADADSVRAQLRNKAIDLHGAVLKVFTPDQRAKCAECCQSGQCGMGCGIGAGICPMGGCGMGPGAGMGMGGGCGMGTGMGPNGTGCPYRQ